MTRLLLALSGAASLYAQTVAIVNARVYPVSGPPLDNGTVVVRDGKIAAVGARLAAPAGARVIDAKGGAILPGFIDAGNRLGLIEIGGVPVTVDATEYTDPLHPELRVIDGLNPRSENIKVARSAGVTHGLSVPAEGNLFAGQSAFLQLAGDTVREIAMKSPAALHINLGEPSKQTYGAKNRAPSTRMGQAALVRQEFERARNYAAQHEAFAKRKPDEKPAAPPATDLRMEALLLALRGEVPVVFRAEQLNDIQTALRLADEFKLKPILSGATAAWRVAADLAARKLPVILGPIDDAPGAMEQTDNRLDTAAILDRAGVMVALQTGASNQARGLPMLAALAMAHGLSESSALAAVTTVPAKLFGMDARLGTIEPGKDASLVVLTGPPFRVASRVAAVLIEGRVMDLSNRQTELFETYRKRYGVE